VALAAPLAIILVPAAVIGRPVAATATATATTPTTSDTTSPLILIALVRVFIVKDA
jgi:hypothetical protein